jgi:hypothetical protein
MQLISTFVPEARKYVTKEEGDKLENILKNNRSGLW